ncbi:MAG: hypothetical protein HY965_06930, partial [Ignavibacteriales bacterium]|nr:hypothetical protein [Ignavibacteriales bacterium]
MNNKNVLYLSVLLISFTFSAIHCKKNPVSAVTVPKVTLTVEEISCTEAWIRIRAENLEKLQNAKFFINDVQHSTFSLRSTDTLVYIDSLQVKKQYRFLIAGSYINEYDNETPISFLSQTCETPDTATHYFSWQIYELGTTVFSGSFIFDAVVINDNKAWLASEIYLDDGQGNVDTEPYGATLYNGSGFELKKVFLEKNENHPYNAIARFHSVKTDEAGEIYFSTQTGVYKYKNGKWEEKAFFLTYEPFNHWVYNMWVTKQGTVYCAADSGILYQVNGTQWKKNYMGTEMLLGNLSGIEDGSGGVQLYLVGLYGDGRKAEILKTNGMTVVEKIPVNEEYFVSAIWVPNKYTYFYGGVALYRWVNGQVKAYQMEIPGRISVINGKSQTDF